jgi:hypothetical protein
MAFPVVLCPTFNPLRKTESEISDPRCIVPVKWFHPIDEVWKI